MNSEVHMGRILQPRATRPPVGAQRMGTPQRAREGGFGGMCAPRHTDAFNVEFVLRVAACIDWTALQPWMAAVDSKLGAPLPGALYKLHVLASWFRLDPPALARACTVRADFRRFIAAPLHGPLVDVQLYLRHADDFVRARQALLKLKAAVELQLVEQGFFPPTDALGSIAVDDAPEPADPTKVQPPTLRTGMPPQPAPTVPHHAATSDGAMAQPCGAIPSLVWPWGVMTKLSRRVQIGRDYAFCAFAEHLAADRKVSRQHAVVTPVGTGVLVQDLGASNGTYIDDEPIPHGSSRLVTVDACLRFGTDLAVMLVFVPGREQNASQ